MNLKESCSLNQKNFDHVKSIEKEVYPPRMHTYQDFDDIEELLDYNGCDGQIDCIIKNDWYAIFCNGPTEVEITDFASRKPLGFAEILEVKNKLQSFGDKIISMNARESTSYRIIKLGERRGWFKIISDEPNITFGEPMHEIIMKVIPQTSFKEWLYIIEAIDANTKNLLTKAKAPQDQLNAFIKELEDEPTLIDNKTAFQRFQDKFVTKKEKPKDEDAQRKHFANIPNTTEEELQTYDYYKNESPQSLRRMMEQLRKFIDKKLITLKIENNIPNLYRNNQKLDTPDFSRFTSQLDSIQAEITKYSGKGNKPNPLELELSHAEHRVAKGDNIWVFKGHRPNICRILGKNQRWCISSGTSAAHWFSYRIQHHQTQYFVFDFNKDENDPARYVNPGVAPEGMYSEWVDAENKHSTDPDARGDRSHVGINGYKSINEYKEYLESKGIPLTTWTTTPPEDWEKRLHRYYQWNQEEDSVNGNKSFASAKNDEHPEVFDMYLKITNTMKDSDFETLTDDQKREFLLSKIQGINEKQFNYAIENFKGEYYNSLDLNGKIRFAGRTNDQEKLLKFTKDNSIEDIEEDNIYTLFEFAKNPDELIISLIDNSYIFKQMPEYISGNIIRLLITYAENKEKIARKLGTKLINQMDQENVEMLMHFVVDKDETANVLVNYKTNLDGPEVKSIIRHAKSKNLIAYSLKSANINKMSTFDIENLLSFPKDRQIANQIANIIAKYKTNLNSLEVKAILEGTPSKNLYDIAEKLGEHNINKIKLEDMSKMLKTLTYDGLDEDDNRKITLSKVLNQYHTNKTPEIQELIDKYINYLKDRGTSY